MNYIPYLPYVCCHICGRAVSESAAEYEGWLVEQRRGKQPGHLVIRCPDHITDYALRAAGTTRETWYALHCQG